MSAATTPAPDFELSVVVPTRNERDNIAPLVARLAEALRALRWEVIFVDDDSPDQTAACVRALAARDGRVRLIHRLGQRGLASACVAGLRAAAAPYVAVMDADLQHDAALLPRMLEPLRSGELDLVVASRYVRGGSTGGWAARRERLSRLAARLARAFSRARLADPMSGYFVIRRTAFEAALPHLAQLGFKLLFDILVSSPRPLRCREMPCRFAPRRRGASKLDALVELEFAALLVNKLTGGLVPPTLLLFLCVGGSGVLVHLGVLRGLLSLGVPFVAAQSGAVLAAMTSNFCLNNLITYRDQRLTGWRWLRGLAAFYAVCAVGALANVSLASLVWRLSPRWWLAGLAGAALGAAWNYLASQRLSWPAAAGARRARRGRHVASERPTQR